MSRFKSAKKYSYDELYVLAFVDSLTGAFNKCYLDEINENKYSYLVFIDIDNFKEINDLYGHSEGDLQLSIFTENIKYFFYKDDVIRYGGDEFIILTNENKLKIIEQRLIEIKKSFKFSYGIVEVKNNISAAIKEADAKMYKMKRGNKNETK